MIHTSPSTAKKFALDYDRHGDSYFSGTTEEKLRLVFQKIEKEVGSNKILVTFIRQAFFIHFFDILFSHKHIMKTYINTGPTQKKQITFIIGHQRLFPQN